MTTRFSRLIIFLVLSALVLSACGGNAPVQEEKPSLVVGWSLYPGWYPLVLAQELGLFEKYGVTVELVRYDQYDDTAPALASGMVDGAAMVLGDALLDKVGSTSSVVLITDNSHGADQLIASADVMESKDLHGKRIGVSTGTFGELLVREMLKKYDLSPSDVILVEVPPEQVADSIPAIIDIGHTFEPFASQARAKGNGVLYTSADAPGIIVDTIAFRNNILQDRPEDIRNFINAWFEAVAYWQANPEEGNTIIAQATGQSLQDVNFDGIRFFNREDNVATFQPGNDTSSVVFTAQLEMDFLIATGIVTTPVNLGQLLNASYIQ